MYKNCLVVDRALTLEISDFCYESQLYLLFLDQVSFTECNFSFGAYSLLQ